MRLRPERVAWLALCVLGACWCGHATAGPAAGGLAQAADAPRADISDAALDAAVAQLRKDRNVGGEKMTKALRWSGRDEQAPKPAAPPAAWLVQLFEYLAQTANLLIWIVGIVAAGFVGVGIYRFLRSRGPRAVKTPVSRPVRVGEFDIRPESLPDDIGAAARALLEAGRTREALSLLYRGALSRAVHGHGVLIGEAFTENEVLREVDARLDAPRALYIRELVRLWQRAVYAGEHAATESVASLCAGFGPALGATVGGAP